MMQAPPPARPTGRPRTSRRASPTRARRALGLPVLLLGLSAATLPARAEPMRAVVELFTSQGCAACRTADPVIGDLARRPGVIALTLPVTYWDYLGWKDTLAQAGFTARQRGYAGGHGARPVFTPQAVVNGGPSAVGSDRPGLDRILREQPARGLPVTVRGEEAGGRILVDVGAAAEPGIRGDVWLVPVLRSRPVAIERGENRGRVATYVNVARGIERLGTWTGLPARYEAPGSAARVGEADSWVVLVQSGANGRPGRILGAAKGPGL